MADRVLSGKANLGAMRGNSKTVNHATMYPGKMSNASRGGNLRANTPLGNNQNILGVKGGKMPR